MSEVSDTKVILAVHEQRLDGHDKAIDGLTVNVSRAIWALVGFSLTITGSAVAVVLGS